MVEIDPGEATEVVLSRGHPQHVRVWRGSGPLMVLGLHGLEGHARWYGALGVALSRHGVTLVAADRAGSGLDPRPRGDSPHIDAWLDELVDLCERVAPPDGLFLMGHSWGAKRAVVALHGRMMPVRAGLLVAPSIYLQQGVVPPERWDAVLEAAGPEPCFPIHFDEERLTDDEDLRHAVASDPERLRYVTANFLIENARLSRRIEAMRSPLPLPCWLALGQNDRMIDAEPTRRWFDRVAPSGRVDVIEGAGHLVLLERAEVLAERVARFLGAVT